MGRLDNRVALVTGGARGLGAGIVEAFVREGATVVCADVIDAGPLLERLGAGHAGSCQAIRLDVTDTQAVEDAVRGVVREHGRLDVMANNAGVAQPIVDVVDTPDEVIDRVFAVNVKGVIACCRAGGRVMREQQSGRIINTASQTGRQAWPGWGVYSASKAAVIGITQVLALELAPHVLVNCICPGTMVSDMMYTGFGEAARTAGRDRDEMIAEHAARIPVRRMGTAEDVGAMAAFLASDDSAFTTGTAVNLTGGECVFF
jgi:3-oxoacyl-[acyl-carrier protein] reductase/sorbitol-6-phosphate 2-dehydrogenase